jgi:dimethylamine corrinoid protein
MSTREEYLFQALSDAVVDLDEEKASENAKFVIEENIDAYRAVDKGLALGMDRAGNLFEEGEYFVPELLIAADAMYAGLDVLRPHIQSKDAPARGKVVIGVIEGDTHDIGKNLVKIILEAKGFDVYDLGRDISPVLFVDKAVEVDADIIALSTLMTTTMSGMARVIDILKERNVRNHFKVIVGGAPVSNGFAQKIGADGYSPNANNAGELAVRLLEEARVGA